MRALQEHGSASPSAASRAPVWPAIAPELLATSARQRRIALVRPLVCVAAFALLAHLGWWAATPIAVFLLFVAIVTVAHDLVHAALGLGERASDWALFLAGALVLESGHAYRASHHRHHAVFPGPDDPEGDPARMTMLGALLHGPIFLPRLWCWAWSRSARGSGQRRWLALEATWALVALGAALVAWPAHQGALVFVVQVVVGSWVYPLLTVHLPHRGYGDTPLTQTHTLRGRIVPALFLELTYHLEHHLHPDVPSHSLPALSRRLEPFLLRAGVRPRRVP